MPYRTCKDCGTRKHTRCYRTMKYHDWWKSLSPSERRDWEKRRQMLDDAIRKFWGVPKTPHYY